MQRVLHRARLELLLRPESLLLVEHLAELAQIHLGHHTQPNALWKLVESQARW